MIKGKGKTYGKNNIKYCSGTRNYLYRSFYCVCNFFAVAGLKTPEGSPLRLRIADRGEAEINGGEFGSCSLSIGQKKQSSRGKTVFCSLVKTCADKRTEHSYFPYRFLTENKFYAKLS